MRLRAAWAVLAVLLLGACSGQTPQEGGTALSTAAQSESPTQDAATRTTPLVPGRPGRVFVFAGVGDNCEPLPAPQITVDPSPQKGEITFKPGQTTTIASSKTGKCIGSTASGTGVYYTAREGTSGTDTFALTARMATGETLTRTFSVTIAP